MQVRYDRTSQSRLVVVGYAVLAVFLLLVYGLWRLQVAGSDYYGRLAEQNRVRTIPVLAPRGKIYDREGRMPSAPRT